MPSFSPDNISGLLITIYLLVVALLGVFSLVCIAILFKHAEKQSIATMVTTAYIILFLAIVSTSIGALLRL